MKYKLRRIPWNALCERIQLQVVHNFLPVNVVVPLFVLVFLSNGGKFVLVFLSKGGKFVPDRQYVSSREVHDALPQLKRQLLMHQYFDASNTPPPNIRARKRSAWQPPEDSNVGMYTNLVSASMESYTPLAFKPSLSYFDKCALKWLRTHSNDIMVLDSDKGLGDCLMTREWVNSKALALLHAACRQLSQQQCNREIWNAQCVVQDAVAHHCSMGHITAQQRAFLLEKVASNTVGTFRLRPKIHKEVLDARPVFNFSASWIQPIAIFLCDILEPINNACVHVVGNTDAVISKLKYCGLRMLSDPILLVIDIKNLYPSIDQNWLLLLVCRKIRSHLLAQTGFATLACNLLGIIIKAQHTRFGKDLFKAVVGIGTGLACGVFLANVLLDDFDHHVTQAGNLDFFCRFVDDALCLTQAQHIDSIISAANSWHRCIVCEATAFGTQVNYLDLSISINSGGSFEYQLFRKPLNIYQYLPRASCHNSHVFDAVVHSEATRIFRRCSDASCAESHLLFFLHKLVRRGYAVGQILRQFKLAKSRHKIFKADGRIRFSNVGTREGSLKIRHSSSVNYRFIKKCLAEHKHLLSNTDSLICAATVQKNIFRISSFLLCGGPIELAVGGRELVFPNLLEL